MKTSSLRSLLALTLLGISRASLPPPPPSPKPPPPPPSPNPPPPPLQYDCTLQSPSAMDASIACTNTGGCSGSGCASGICPTRGGLTYWGTSSNGVGTDCHRYTGGPGYYYCYEQFKWQGGALGSDGRIYGAPFAADTILAIDTSTMTSSNFPTAAAPGSAGTYGSGGGAPRLTTGDPDSDKCKWDGMTLAPNGKLYSPPCCADSVLVVNQSMHTTSTLHIDNVGLGHETMINLTSFSDCKWKGGFAVASNGKLYAAPAAHGQVLEVDPDTDTHSFVGGPWTSATTPRVKECTPSERHSFFLSPHHHPRRGIASS
jgi:hypothetical protein